MAEIVIGRWKPPAGSDPKEWEVPGPGLYEADFDIPGWAFPDLDIEKEKTFRYNGVDITHIRSVISGNRYTLKFRITEVAAIPAATPQTEALFVGLTIAAVLRYLAVIGLGAIAGYVVSQVAESLREVRKLAETPAGIGLAALGVGAGVLILVGALKG